jgi:hypothetical protein
MYRCAFRVSLRVDDAPILWEIRERTGIGRVKEYAARKQIARRGHGVVQWQVDSRRACEELIVLLDRYPLRAKKRRDYELWREAVAVWATVTQGAQSKSTAAWTGMAYLAHHLKACRSMDQR